MIRARQAKSLDGKKCEGLSQWRLSGIHVTLFKQRRRRTIFEKLSPCPAGIPDCLFFFSEGDKKGWQKAGEEAAWRPTKEEAGGGGSLNEGSAVLKLFDPGRSHAGGRVSVGQR